MDPDLNERLTAYALGELDPDQHAEIESILAGSEGARAFVAETRAMGCLLSAELSLETSPGLSESGRASLFAAEARAVPEMKPADEDYRSDVYRVITHPEVSLRRYRFELLAIAAAVAIVASMLTVICTSLFRTHGVVSGPIAMNQVPTMPLNIPSIPGDAEILPDVANGFTSRPPRELIAPEIIELSQPFGVAPAVATVPNRISTTQDGSGPSGIALLTVENPFFSARLIPVSSFSYPVGSSAYNTVRRAVQQKQRPAVDAVRIEQLINYFPYRYASPIHGDTFAAAIEISACPWAAGHRLVRIGLKSKEADNATPIAEDLQIQVELNPARVGAYRLIGYDRNPLARALPGDAGKHNQILPSQSVTALYEVIPAGDALPSDSDDLKYQKMPELTAAAQSAEWLTVRLRFMDPITSTIKSQSFTAKAGENEMQSASDDFKFAAAVAGFGLLLRDSPHRGDANYDLLLSLAGAGQHSETLGERTKFIELLQQARGL